MNVLSLFSGVGGFDYGLENAGMKTIYQCEWDKHANSILERHWPQVPRWGDITTLTAKEILRHGTPPDVVAWGSPCQDLSVAGKRAGLEGERSGLFHEGIRIINELRKETNNEYPKISIWENVAGALSSNRGADFGVIINEMAKAGAMVIEWGLLDAQHFGIPQRRRRVFCIAIFNSATANLCPSPLLPVSESLPRDTAKGKPKRKSSASEVADSIGDSRILGSDIVGSLNTSDVKMISTQYVNENKVVVEPYVKSRRAQSATDDETWVPGEVNPTLNSFDVGDTRATTAIIEPMLLDGRRIDDVRVYEPPVQTLGARMGTGGNNVPMLAFDTQFGSNANVFEDQSPTLKASQAAPSVAYPIDTRNALRDPEKYDAQNRQGLGIGNDGDPMATLTSAHVNAVAYDEYNDSINETHHALRAGTKQSTGVLLENEIVGTLRSGGSGGVPSSRGEHLVTESTGVLMFQDSEWGVKEYDTAGTLRSGRIPEHQMISEPSMAVRRLTPLECERLMGWPDDHTRYKADGTEQADTHRYKQCGNGVASPVAEWIGKQLMKLQTSLEG
jgi:DNA (cytosine-5)-methyltransferase 1